MRFISNISRLLLGVVFIFSGFVKVVDPLGVKYKFYDYFVAMNLESLSSLALTFGVLLAVAELLIGISLLFNSKPVIGSWGVLLFMGVFLPLTLWIAIADPVQDCGCFGDAIILSNWATFWKNVVLLVFTIIVFLNRKKFKPSMPVGAQWLVLIVFAGGTFWLSMYCLKHLPVLDFRPYRVGNNILQGMIIPESEKDNVDEYKTILIYKNKKTGELKEFSMNELPDEDTWEWQETKNELIKKGYTPPIHDFSITPVNIQKEKEPEMDIVDPASLFDALYVYDNGNETLEFHVNELPVGSNWQFVEIIGNDKIQAENVALSYQGPDGISEFTLFDLPDEEWSFVDATYYRPESTSSIAETPKSDISDIVLEDDAYYFFLVSHDITEANTSNTDKINALYEYCLANDIKFYCMTASLEPDIKEYIKETGAEYPFYSTDPITLETIVRANPGLVLLRKGTVLDKWSAYDIPDVENLNTHLTAYALSKRKKQAEKNLIFSFIFGALGFYFIVELLIQFLRRKRILIDFKSSL